jgi:regulator of sigma E protease
LIQTAQLILSLSILVILHELGHFIPARLFKTRVEKFYLFFDPWFSLFKFKKGDTEYGIGWLPLGGYVKIAGMIDESMDKEQLKNEPQPWEFRSKPAWQRLIIMLGGVTVNAILGVFIYAMVLFVWGQEYIPTSGVKYGIHADSLALEIGLKDGDKIISVDNKVVDKFNYIPLEIILNNARSIQVERGGETLSVTIPEELIGKLIKHQKTLIEPAFLPIVQEVIAGTPASKAGMEQNDRIIALNSQNTPFFHDVVKYLQANKNNTVVISVLRNNDTLLLPEVTVTDKGTLGFAVQDVSMQLEVKTEKYGLLEAFPAGAKKGYETFDSYIKQMKLISKSPESVGGFISIGKQFGSEWDWQRFWLFTAFLSIVLAIMNLLPIPALDGGHVMFLTYEIITGRKPNEKFMEYAQMVGMILLLALLLYANGNDILKLFK